MGREKRLAQNEVLFREVNERLEELGRRTGTAEDGIDFVCECAEETCTQRILLTLTEYERLRSDPRQFAVRPGHERPIERIVVDRGSYRVVEKVGVAGEIAEDADPRE